MSINMGMRAKLSAIIDESTAANDQTRRATAMNAHADSKKFDVSDPVWWKRRTEMGMRWQLLNDLGITVQIPATTDNVFDLIPAT